MYDAVRHGTNHFILYAKGHYREDVLLDDLKKIMAHRLGWKPDDVQIKDIVFLLSGVVETLTVNRPNFLQAFLMRIREDFLVWPNVLPRSKQPTFDEVLIQACLGELGTAEVRSGAHVRINLGSPDPTILPLRNPSKAGVLAGCQTLDAAKRTDAQRSHMISR